MKKKYYIVEENGKEISRKLIDDFWQDELEELSNQEVRELLYNHSSKSVYELSRTKQLLKIAKELKTVVYTEVKDNFELLKEELEEITNGNHY